MMRLPINGSPFKNSLRLACGFSGTTFASVTGLAGARASDTVHIVAGIFTTRTGARIIHRSKSSFLLSKDMRLQ
jgi:hypothetical protein